jgi:hypothetical protein
MLVLPQLTLNIMKNRAQIDEIDFIKNKADGTVLNLIILRLTNGKDILRPLTKFLIDLENSNLIGSRHNISINSQKFLSLLIDLEGATVKGDFRHVKAGDKWKVEADHPMFHDENHPLFGKHEVGDEIPYKSDGTPVNGFLKLTMSASVRQMYIQSEFLAEASLMAKSAFGVPATPEPAMPIETKADNNGFDPANVDPSIIDQATGGDNAGNNTGDEPF